MLVEKWGTKHYPLPVEMKAPFMRQIRLPDLKKYPNEAKVKKSIRLAVEYINLL